MLGLAVDHVCVGFLKEDLKTILQRNNSTSVTVRAMCLLSASITRAVGGPCSHDSRVLQLFEADRMCTGLQCLLS